MFRPIPSEEVYRKLLHVLVVVLPLGIFYIPIYYSFSRSDVAWSTLVILLLSIAIELFRFRSPAFGNWYFSSFGSMLREEEKSQLTGATYVAAGTFLCACLSLVSESFSAYAFLSLTLFILGDAAAALVGKSMGRVKVGKKTMEGAVGCFLLCLSLAYWIFPYLPKFTEVLGKPFSLVQLILISVTVSLLELFPIRVKQFTLNDNLYVPVLATCAAAMSHRFI
jgi:dolichol kinase